MLTWLIIGLMLVSVLAGTITGNMGEVSRAALSGCGDAVELLLILLGTMALWGGVMRVAEESGLSRRAAALLWPVLRRLFPKVPSGSPAAQRITMNVISNMMGLGNAATPLGLAAMAQLQKENPHPDTATDSMVTFLVLNTACIQVIPTTTAALRAQYGSLSPLEILPCVWISSVAALLLALMASYLLRGRRKAPVPAAIEGKVGERG